MKPLFTKSYLLPLLLLTMVIMSCLPLFTRLGDAPIYMWDEATYANNALDMYITHDPIVVRMEGLPDLYNTKPPFVLWMQTLSLYLFGWNEYAIRFPSAFFAALTMLLLLWFGLAVLNSPVVAVASMLTLVCSKGLVTVHVARSGDLDATLVFWSTFYVLLLIKYLLKGGQPALHFFLVACGLTGAFLTKGIAGWFFVPLLVIIALINRSFLRLLRQKEVYLAAGAVLLIAAGYYYLRELMAPGYWAAVYKYELLRFNTNVMIWHVQPYDFYFQNMLHRRFTPFLFLLPFSLLVFFFQEERTIRKTLLFLWIFVVGYSLLISYPADKLEWYDAPMYPFLSLIMGIFISFLVKQISDSHLIQSHSLFRNSVAPVVFMAVFSVPYYQMMKSVLATDEITYSWDPHQIDPFRITGAFMKRIKEKFPELRSYSILQSPPHDPEHFDQLKFYQRTYQMKDGFSIPLKNNVYELNAGENALVCEKSKQDSLETRYSFQLIDTWKGCKLYSIKSLRSPHVISSGSIQ